MNTMVVNMKSQKNAPSALSAFTAFLAKMIVRLWDDITQTPTAFSFTENPDKTKVDVVLYCYSVDAYYMVPVGVKFDRGADKFNRYSTRAINRLLKNANLCGFMPRYIEKPMTNETVWSSTRL